MSSDIRWEVQKIVTDMRTKYVYFLLAAVGASIGFAITQSKGIKFNLWALPLAVAIGLWALSFIFGCRYLHNNSNAFARRASLVELETSGTSIFNNLNHRMNLIENLSELVQSIEASTTRLYRYQFWSFVLGALSFIVWHAIMIWLQTAEQYACLLWS